MPEQIAMVLSEWAEKREKEKFKIILTENMFASLTDAFGLRQ
jgi:hypothetical protein